MHGVLGEIRLWAGNFAPQNWLYCWGQELRIDYPYKWLFGLIGTVYGGNGVTTYKLPDLRGRIPTGAGYCGYGYYTDLAEELNSTQAGFDGLPLLGLNCIICYSGMYPSRP